MGKTYLDELKRKTVSADEAVKVIESGDWIEYSHFAMVPRLLDAALARRKGQLSRVCVRGVCTQQIPAVALIEPKFEHFIYHSGFFSTFERSLGDRCQPWAENYGRTPINLRRSNFTPIKAAFIAATPMDKHGFFNFSTSCSATRALCDIADIVVIETNARAPRCLGGEQEGIHINNVDFVVEGTNEPLMVLPNNIPATDVEKKIATYIISQVENRSCIQLGIGSLANYIGMALAETDLKDLGMHSEMMCDAYLDLYESGRLTGKYKQIERYKMTYTFAMGSKRLYDFLDNNPVCATSSVDITNDPHRISLNDNMISINNILMVDLYGQAASEMVGYRHISGTGGQHDFLIGAYRSEGGKSFLCLPSTRTLNEGQVISRIVPALPQGMVITNSRTVVDYVVTEYGMVHLPGKTAWQRAEMLIGIAHPDFREELVEAAKKQNIWTNTNKI